MPPHNKLGAVVVLIAAGLFASFGLTWPARDVSLYGLSFTLSGRMLLGLVVFGLACSGTDAVVRGHPQIQPQQLRLSFLHWVLPAALTTVAWVLLTRPDSTEVKGIVVTITSGLLALVIAAEHHTVDPTGRWRTAVQFSLRLVTYLLAMLLYIAIHLGIPADLAAAITVAMSSVILGFRVLCDDECTLKRLWPYVLGLGALLGIASWLLNLWIASPVLHSIALVVLLYVLTGMVRQFLLGKLTRKIALEYLLAGALVLWLLLSYVR